MEKENKYLQGKMDWKRIWLLFVKNIWVMVVLLVISAAIGAIVYRIAEAITYEGQFYRVSSDYYIRFNEDQNGVDYYNAYTWDNILRDDPIVEEALKLLPDTITKEQVKDAVTGVMLGDYRILTVYATSEDPEVAEAVATAYTESLANFAKKIDMLDTIELWSQDECVPLVEEDLTPNAAVLGALIGLVFLIFGFATYYVLDDSVYVESDFSERFTIPFLGMLTPKNSTLCKQELQDNLSYLLKESGKYYLVHVAADREMPKVVLESVKTLHGGMAGSVSLQGEDLDTLRKSDGAVLMIPWGSKNGRVVEKTIQFLDKQDCKVSGAIFYNADDAFLKKYYNTRKGR